MSIHTYHPCLLRAKSKTTEEAELAKLICLIPELCSMTGLTDQMKADFRVMKDVAVFTRVTPSQRQAVGYRETRCLVQQSFVCRH